MNGGYDQDGAAATEKSSETDDCREGTGVEPKGMGGAMAGSVCEEGAEAGDTWRAEMRRRQETALQEHMDKQPPLVFQGLVAHVMGR